MWPPSSDEALFACRTVAIAFQRMSELAILEVLVTRILRLLGRRDGVHVGRLAPQRQVRARTRRAPREAVQEEVARSGPSCSRTLSSDSSHSRVSNTSMSVLATLPPPASVLQVARYPRGKRGSPGASDLSSQVMAILELVRSRPDWPGALGVALTRPAGTPERRGGQDHWNPDTAGRPRRISDDLAWFATRSTSRSPRPARARRHGRGRGVAPGGSGRGPTEPATRPRHPRCPGSCCTPTTSASVAEDGDTHGGAGGGRR